MPNQPPVDPYMESYYSHWPVPYTGGHHQTQPLHYVHPIACKSEDDTDCGLQYKDGGPARSIDEGIFQALCKDGTPASFATITVTFAGTPNLVALYRHPRGATEDMIPNPVTTDHRGRAQIRFKGGPVDVVVESCDGEILDRYTNYGGYVDGDFDLQSTEYKACISIDNPRVRIYDADRCNLPDVFTDPKNFVMYGLWQSGQPIGSYSDAIAFFACVGIDFPCDLIVYGDTDRKRYQYNCTDCNLAVPPDPESETYDDQGQSACWTDLNFFDVSSLLSDGLCSDLGEQATDAAVEALMTNVINGGSAVYTRGGCPFTAFKCGGNVYHQPLGRLTYFDAAYTVLSVDNQGAGNVAADSGVITVTPDQYAPGQSCIAAVNVKTSVRTDAEVQPAIISYWAKAYISGKQVNAVATNTTNDDNDSSNNTTATATFTAQGTIDASNDPNNNGFVVIEVQGFWKYV